jgi:hypothetical protein
VRDPEAVPDTVHSHVGALVQIAKETRDAFDLKAGER